MRLSRLAVPFIAATLAWPAACGSDEPSETAQIGAGGAVDAGNDRADTGRQDTGTDTAVEADAADGDAANDAFDAGNDADASAPICLHDVCTVGDYLEVTCNPCTQAICDLDDICCSTQWDDYCLLATLDHPDVCSCPGESRCADFADDDLDRDVDCGDADCRDAGECSTGAGKTGEPCAGASDCASATGAPICFDAELRGFAQGYCSSFCEAPSDCGAGAVCLPADFGNVERGTCFAVCDPAASGTCRAGYSCQERESSNVCLPRDEDCANAVDDNLDGRVDCDESACQFADNCQEICDNGIDDTANGKIDCEDSACSFNPLCAHPACENIADDATSTCVLFIGGWVRCNPITNEGCADDEVCDFYIGGFDCYRETDGEALCASCTNSSCAAGTTCVGIDPEGADARCWKYCCANRDCGDGGFCNKAIPSAIIGQTSPVGVCAIDYQQ